MSEKPEKVHVVMRQRLIRFGLSPNRLIGSGSSRPVKVADDRKDARAYAKLMSSRSRRYRYWVETCPKL